MTVWFYALGSVLLVSLTSLAGAVTLSLGQARLQRLLFLLVAFAVGAMLGGALLHLIPEAYETLGGGPRTGLLVLAGVMTFFVLEKFLHWQHQHGAPEAIEGATGHSHHDHSHGDPLATMSIVGTVAHHLIDGAVVAAAYGVSIEAGIVTTLAVMAHEVPQQIGMFGILVYAGLKPRKALGLNLLVGLATLPSAIAVLALGASGAGLHAWLLPITAGSFLYVAGSDLIPELNRRHSYPATKAVGQLVMMLLGIGLMAALLLLE